MSVNIKRRARVAVSREKRNLGGKGEDGGKINSRGFGGKGEFGGHGSKQISAVSEVKARMVVIKNFFGVGGAVKCGA